MQMPEYLDWMPIEVKAEWFRFIGQGPDDTHYIVFVSQGQEILLDGVALAQIDHKTFLQKEASAEEHINRFIEEKGYSREPRNQLNALRALLLSSATAMPITFAAKDKEIAKVEDNSNVPDFMREDSRLGKENIGNDDRIIPRVQLAAAISTPVTEGKVEAGHFYHTVLEEDLGETLDIVIVHHSKRYTLWTPRHMGGGILARASDALNWDNGDQDVRGHPA